MPKKVTLTIMCNTQLLFNHAAKTSAHDAIGVRLISALLGEPGLWEATGLSAYGIEIISRKEEGQPDETALESG